jgi:predicted flap endonuclease-1-like 5' DNA nuclease
VQELEGELADASVRAQAAEAAAVAADVAAGGAVALAGDLPSQADEPEADVLPDLAAGAAVLGADVLRHDDLQVIEGIGPKIAEILNAKGILTWHHLSRADAADILDALHAAGPSFKMHDPRSWPEQAALLTEGRWEEFIALTERLIGGRS